VELPSATARVRTLIDPGNLGCPLRSRTQVT
jgi:hypothetical protein